MQVNIICPRDKTILNFNDPDQYICPLCGKEFKVEDGVIRLVQSNDEFYEGAYENQIKFVPKNEKLWSIWPVWLINSGYPWLVRKQVKAGGIVVELGCASGVKYFGARYTMVGCDISHRSLKNLNGIYDYLLQSNVTQCIPLANNSVDAVISSFFWEHIPPETKPLILSECYRVLKPEGKLIFLYDVETQNPLIYHYKKRNPKLYKQLFLDGDGHVGYQLPEDNLTQFRAAGLDVILHKGLEKTLVQLPSVYIKLSQFGTTARFLFGWMKIFCRSPWIYLYTLLVRLIDCGICPWLPQKWARIDMVLCKKNNI